MAKKVLFCATVDYHFKAFHLPYMKWFKEQGWDVHVAAAGSISLPYTDEKFVIPIQRTPFHKGNIRAFKDLKGIIDTNNYSIIHCHTPLGGTLTRLAARNSRKSGTKVIYTAHGFHFCKGAPLMNWLIYYPIEKYLSKYTDCLITINSEDYGIAVDHRFKAKLIDLVNGVGVDTNKFQPVSDKRKKELRLKLGFKQNDFLLFYAAEFNKNKNQQFLIKVIATLKDEHPEARLLLAGEGQLLEDCRVLAKKHGVSNQIEFLGFRKDIDEILPACDVAVASSYREGLPVNVMEAMACGLPVVASDNRGHRELVKENWNGFIINGEDLNMFSERVTMLYQSKDLRNRMAKESLNFIEKFAISTVNNQIVPIYSRYMMEDQDAAKSKHHRAYL